MIFVNAPPKEGCNPRSCVDLSLPSPLYVLSKQWLSRPVLAAALLSVLGPFTPALRLHRRCFRRFGIERFDARPPSDHDVGLN
jgi:hypothetical protein